MAMLGKDSNHSWLISGLRGHNAGKARQCNEQHEADQSGNEGRAAQRRAWDDLALPDVAAREFSACLLPSWVSSL
jgi:hypothetical protein